VDMFPGRPSGNLLCYCCFNGVLCFSSLLISQPLYSKVRIDTITASKKETESATSNNLAFSILF